VGLASGLNEYAYAGLNPNRYRDPFGTTQQDINNALLFAQNHYHDQTVPPTVTPTNLNQLSPTPGGSDGLGRTVPSGSPDDGPGPGGFSVYVSDEFLGDLNDSQLEDLLETILHEGLHMDQPSDLWSDCDPEVYKKYHHWITDQAWQKMMQFREEYLQSMRQ
jgi:hypothetical protein